jgi:cation diffusion facilitator CzcD-associated flavoprotein CzcO
MNARLQPDLTPAGLAALEQRLHEDLERLCLPADDWLARASDDAVLDVAIVGGGMSGLAAAAALRLLGIRRVQVFDRSPAGEEGPWVTHARMQTLRSPKHLVGPALGLPSLSFRAWYEAQFGREGWAALDRIPREQWQDYLNWFRTALALPVLNDVNVASVAGETLPDGTLGVAFDLLSPGAPTQRVQARHLVLATGMDGLGGPAVPALADALPRTRWQHSSERIDFSLWRGKRLGIVGGGDSALDAAATALEAGAAQVDVFVRGADFARINYWKAFAHPGHYHGFAAMSPAARQPMLDFLKQQKVPPAYGTVKRLARFDNVRLHFNSPVARLAGGEQSDVTVTTPHAAYAVDHLIFATGYRTELAQRPELAQLAPHIRFWSARTPVHASRFALDGFPETAPDFSLVEREPGACPVLGQVHLFTGAALMSQGKLTGDIPGIGHGAERLARGIAVRLYAADFEQQLRAVQAYDELEVHGDEWARIRVDHPAR